MKLFSSLKGQEHSKEILSSAVKSGRLAHAYILAGPNGSGRLTAALDLAKARICPEVDTGFCDECKQCHQIDEFVHPDVRITIPRMKTTKDEELTALLKARASDGVTPLRFPGNAYISIDQMREMSHRLTRKSFEGNGYVEIIYDAHTLRREAANAILKTLEEPPEGALIILVTSRISGMLPTVRSRAHTVRFGRLTNSLVEEVLREKTDVSAKDASRLALHSDGCPGTALLLIKGKPADHSMAENIFSMIFDTSLGDMMLAVQVEAIAKKLGREGIIGLCSDLVSLSHDSRRVLAGSKPISHETVSSIDKLNIDDNACLRMESLFQQCEKRLRGNVSPAMAFSSAVVGSRRRPGH